MQDETNQNKGNTAEYYVCYELQKHGIPVWQLGGNNRRWDIIIQKDEDQFIPAQVKARTQNAVVFRKEDLVLNKGYYFIYYDPASSKHKSAGRLVRYLEKATLRISGIKQSSILLIFDSKHVKEMCEKARNRTSTNKNTITTNMTNSDIEYGIKYVKTFFRKFGNPQIEPTAEED